MRQIFHSGEDCACQGGMVFRWLLASQPNASDAKLAQNPRQIAFFLDITLSFQFVL